MNEFLTAYFIVGGASLLIFIVIALVNAIDYDALSPRVFFGALIAIPLWPLALPTYAVACMIRNNWTPFGERS